MMCRNRGSSPQSGSLPRLTPPNGRHHPLTVMEEGHNSEGFLSYVLKLRRRGQWSDAAIPKPGIRRSTNLHLARCWEPLLVSALRSTLPTPGAGSEDIDLAL